jgi:UDP-N-acetylmuramate dehydrogenase
VTALDRIADQISKLASVRRDEPMSRHTTFGVGGPADLFVTVDSADALEHVARIALGEGLPWFVLGSGSNILVSDAGMRGIVLDNRARATCHDARGLTWRAESGTSFAAFARHRCRDGLAGLTWAVGIPGTLGGAVVYNAGACGGCLADVLTRVELLDDSGDRRWMDASELGLVYRGSAFTRRQFERSIALSIELQLVESDASALLAQAADYDRRRLAAQPRGRNAGSTFKNPPDHPAWKLIDEVGMRGMRRGDAAVSERHSNFFVNLGTARAADVAWLINEAERRVQEQFGIRLEREVAFVGDWS